MGFQPSFPTMPYIRHSHTFDQDEYEYTCMDRPSHYMPLLNLPLDQVPSLAAGLQESLLHAMIIGTT